MEIQVANVKAETEEEAEKIMEDWGSKCGLGTGHTLQEYFPEIVI